MLEVGDTIECADEDDMIEMHQELCEEGYEVDFMYSKDGESGLWLEVKKTPH